MADKNLSDDMVKLVSYSIVSIQRDREHVLSSARRVVTDNMDGEGFASWMIAEYLEESGRKRFKDKELQYLRVSYNVEDRWAEQDLKYEEKQLRALDGIERAIRKEKKKAGGKK
ncbi:MAG: hypothetical protein K0U98_25450 [Deltaproteobacteria bacterium]|nr:hypothetical protein [Deltaproteobacteria bacterium]